MTARENFWYSFAEMLYEEYYLTDYKKQCDLANRIITGFIILVSSTSIPAWALWGKYPLLWAVLVGASQVVGLVLPLFRFQEQITAINFCLPELRNLLNDMEKTWCSVDSVKDETVLSKKAKFADTYAALDSKYISPFNLLDSKSCIESAMKKRDIYLQRFTESYMNEVTV